MKLKKKNFANLLLLFLLGSFLSCAFTKFVRATDYEDWTVSDDWTISDDWHLEEAGEGETFNANPTIVLTVILSTVTTFIPHYFQQFSTVSLRMLVFFASAFIEYVPPYVPIPLEIPSWMQFLYEGDFFGLIQAIYVNAFQSADLFYAVVVLLFTAPIYIRTKSLVFMSIAWILFGGLIIVAMPLVSVVAIFLVAMGLGGLLFKLYMNVRE